ncbi:MAG: biotin--[acetyl-CoA-carboxylase] ligase [Candidatus Nitronauta litoralis]|uniref:biotin--[biotin carboxyl-carrier protein] ligase n=1 Tax=Candidatus Nitronauta litoralis TaxID=2705533 RepID=A0A7T0BYB6_9BACT|nr:MAG: biotin--[acetyl-CoA-carboxylase] ligase [Candidatus Nitronauta litoralis]
MYEDTLDPVFLIENTKTHLLGSRWIFEKSISSTNDLAKQMASEGAPDGSLIVSDTQTMGKGRLGRQWDSPPESGIYLSALLYPPDPEKSGPFLTLLAGVAVVNALNTWCEVTLKWPNDLLTNNKKICGILCEFFHEIRPRPAMVIGIGINVHQKASHFPKEIRQTATSLFMETQKHLSRTRIIKKLVEELDKEYQEFLANGPQLLIQKWSDRSCMFGEVVALKKGKKTTRGIVKRLDSKGHLVLETESGEESFGSGEATILK